MTQWFFNRGVVEQTKAFMAGFEEVMPLNWLQYFDEREFEVFAAVIFFVLFSLLLQVMTSISCS